jgi:hypothetical protein
VGLSAFYGKAKIYDQPGSKFHGVVVLPLIA